MNRLSFSCLGAFLLFLTAGPVSADPSADVIFQAMEEEINRSMTHLKIDVFKPPYYINYQIRDRDHIEVVSSFGALIDSRKDRDRTLFVDVRIGNVDFDSSTPGSHKYVLEQFVPIDDDIDSLRRALWYETDLRYKQAIMNFLKKKGRFVSGVETHDLPDFSKGHSPPVERVKKIPELEVDLKVWEGKIRKISSLFKQAAGIEKSKVRFSADRFVRYHLDSEGNKIRDVLLQYSVVLEAWSKTENGNPIHDQETILVASSDQFPSEEELAERIRVLIEGMSALNKAPRMDPYVGPALFSPDASAVLFHEAIGHRLEGDRLRTVNDGKTFMKKIGHRILPPFLTVLDDPGLEEFDGQDLVGHYEFDDEGQKSQEVVLIDQGVLRNFLLSRTPVLGFSKTNGHARSDGLKAPMARMSNFIIRSEKKFSHDVLKNMLIEEIRKQNKPYGLYVKKILGGETKTESTGFQVFKGKPLYLYKVYPDGREELVRDVEFVGTPLSLIGKVLATGDDARAINGYCGAESGFLPVTTIAPSVLLAEVELQTSNLRTLRKPILSPPDLQN